MKFPDRQYTEQANSISENATEAATPVYNRAVERLRELINASESFGEAQRLTHRHAADEEFIVEFQSRLFDAMTSEDALARSFLLEKDRAFSLAQKKVAAKFNVDGALVSFKNAGWFVFADKPLKISFDLTPEEAIRQMRERSFWIAGIENQELLNRIQKALEDALREGQTWEEFRKKANVIFDEMKATRLAQHRLQTVFRTNLFSSYAKAQIEQLQEMQDRFPLWRYSAILDLATRPAHAALDGSVFRIGEGPYPPLANGTNSDGTKIVGGIAFNCRCTAQHLHAFQIQERKDGVRIAGETQTLKVRDGNSYTLQQILADEQAAFERYLSESQSAMNPLISNTVRNNLL